MCHQALFDSADEVYRIMKDIRIRISSIQNIKRMLSGILSFQAMSQCVIYVYLDEKKGTAKEVEPLSLTYIWKSSLSRERRKSFRQ